MGMASLIDNNFDARLPHRFRLLHTRVGVTGDDDDDDDNDDDAYG
jgi:hypothetical protein